MELLHPYAELIGFDVTNQQAGSSCLKILVRDELLNPNGVVHGGVLYSLADTGMGAALYPALAAGEACATINCSINYFKPVVTGSIECNSTLVNHGKRISTLEAQIWNEGKLVANANGQFSTFRPRDVR